MKPMVIICSVPLIILSSLLFTDYRHLVVDLRKSRMPIYHYPPTHATNRHFKNDKKADDEYFILSKRIWQ